MYSGMFGSTPYDPMKPTPLNFGAGDPTAMTPSMVQTQMPPAPPPMAPIAPASMAGVPGMQGAPRGMTPALRNAISSAGQQLMANSAPQGSGIASATSAAVPILQALQQKKGAGLLTGLLGH